MDPEFRRTALITGASRGFGLLTSLTLASRGWRVLATMRDINRQEKLLSAARNAGVLDRIEVHPLDVTRADQIAAIADLLAARGEPLHALINNAGFAHAGFAEQVTALELRNQFDTNFFGAVAVTRAILPQMHRQGFGHIVMLSSVSGRRVFPRVSSYIASKFALEGWSETLRYELTGTGIKVVLVEPGSFQTAVDLPINPLKTSLSRGDPQRVANLIAKIVETPHPKLRYVIGRDAWRALLIQRLLPAWAFEAWVVRRSRMNHR